MSTSVLPLPELERTLEALLFVSPQPVSHRELATAAGVPTAEIGGALQRLAARYREGGHGLQLLQVAGGWQMTTIPELEQTIRAYRETTFAERIRLSKASLESLAVIAYNQPVTRSEIEEIRGVRSDRVVETLLRYGLVRVAGRRKGTGNPLLFRTTDRFLELFGLNSTADLPSLKELEGDEEPGFPGDEIDEPGEAAE